MADNYLEKKMDDYRRGANSRTPRRSYTNPAAARCLTVEPQRIVAVLSDRALLESVLSLMQGLPGVKVAFAGSDTRAGTQLAQATGALFVPADPHDETTPAKVTAEATKRWDSVDTLLTDIPSLASTASTSSLTAASRFSKVVLIDFAATYSAATPGTIRRNMTVISAPAANPDMKAIAQATLLTLTSPATAISSIALR